MMWVGHDVRRSESAIAGTPVMMDRCVDFYDCNQRRNDAKSRNIDSPKAYELLATSKLSIFLYLLSIPLNFLITKRYAFPPRLPFLSLFC